MPATLLRSQPFRRPRFRRVETPPPFQLTARDLAILHAVARYRFLSSTLIVSLVGGSPQQILRRLRLLFHHGYIDRPTSQVAQLAHAFELACRAEGAPALIDHHDLLPYLPEETREDDAPFHARVTLKTARETLTI